MSDLNNQVTVDYLQAFADAFNRHDVDALMTFMTDDCIFEVSWGPDVNGERLEGQTAVRDGLAKVIQVYPDARWNDPTHFEAGNRGVSTWRFTGTGVNGEKVEVDGCDVFRFGDGKIQVKDSYRKIRTPAG